MIFSKGNRKLPKTTAIWNLPSGLTCPKSTIECRKWCYANKAEKMYPNVLPFRIKNFKLTKQPNFKEILIKELKQLKGIKQIRIHESGDFYNQKYLNDWITIAKTFSDKIFYAYTKSYHLNFKERPKNFIILLSDDNSEHQDKYYKFDGVTKVSKTIDLKENYFTCLGNCKLCDVCFKPSRKFKQINFHIH